MAKVYQHMQPGDTLGKITYLKYIDDVSDDELILYVFSDGSKCDEKYIAEINNKEAFGKYMLVELTDPLNKWEFKESSYDLNKTRTVINEYDGQEYEIPDPGITVSGEHISLETSESGTPIHKSLPMNGKRIEAIPPREIKNKKVEPKENYLLSLHPELINGNSKDNNQHSNLLSNSLHQSNQNKVKTNQNKLEEELKNTKNKFIEEIDNSKVNNIKSNIVMQKSPITTNIIETVKHASIVINLDDIKNSEEYDTVKLIVNGVEQELDIHEFTSRLLNKINKNSNTTNKPEYTYQDEDILITNMIDKSKKKECTIGLDMKLELPPKEVYKTIKTIYSEDLAQQFVLSVARRIDAEQLKQILANGLQNYYEQSFNNTIKTDDK